MHGDLEQERIDLQTAENLTLGLLERPDLSDEEARALRARVDYIRERLRKLGLPGEPGSGLPPAKS